MMKRFLLLTTMLVFVCGIGFSQAGSVRDFVGIINQSYHPSIVEFFEDIKKEWEDEGNTAAANSVERYLRGPFGTGFVYVDDKGDNYVITNNHVINQAYNLKFTLEKADGSKIIYEGLKVFAVDEDLDMAVLIFEDRRKPFTNSMPFFDGEIDEGENVFSAGFPGIGLMPIYQFGSGIVSNRRTMLPVSLDSDEMIGPFVQHTAPIDPGNSGGPLLVRLPGTGTAQYAVVGINTRKVMWRDSANYAIPAGLALEFITRATGPEQGDQKAKLEERINEFIGEVKAPKAVYEKISTYLSNACIADNAEYALLELVEKGNRTVWNNISDAFSHDPVTGMQLAVAWLVENSMRTGSGVIKIDLESVSPINEKKYTVKFTINDESVSSTWELEYGIWRISTFGSIVVGDKSMVTQREKAIKSERDLFTDYTLLIQAGVAIMPDAPTPVGFNAGLKVFPLNYVFGGADFIVSSDYSHVLGTVGFMIPIRLGAVAIMPFVEGGIGIAFADEQEQKVEDDFYYNDPPGFGFDLGFGWGIKGGLVFTTKWVKGLYLYADYQYSGASVGFFDDKQTLNNSIISIGLGYAF